MSRAIAMTVGPEDALRVVLGEFKDLAAPGKLPPTLQAHNLRRYGDIEVYFDMSEVGLAVFRFVTQDDCDVTFSIYFDDFGREELETLKHDVRVQINRHRAQRGPIEIGSNSFH